MFDPFEFFDKSFNKLTEILYPMEGLIVGIMEACRFVECRTGLLIGGLLSLAYLAVRKGTSSEGRIPAGRRGDI